MWFVQQDPLDAGEGVRCTLSRNGEAVTVRQVIQGWRTDADFRALFNRTLAESPFSAFRWETPRATAASLGQAFEFVLLDQPELDRPADPGAFEEHVETATDGIAVFANLSGDAVLIVPSPEVDQAAYGHLAAFARHAHRDQQQALWRAVGAAMSRRVGTRPVWLSTAGAGVPWLHIRLDDRPKYYHYAPYAR